MGLAAGCGGDERDGVAARADGAPVIARQSPELPVPPSLELAARALPAAVVLPPEIACLEGDVKRLRSRRAAYAAIATGPTEAFARPGGDVTHRFERLNVNGVPTVFGVLAAVLGPDCQPVWYRVQLPVRPNGAVGYVRAAAVEVARVTTRVEVDLSERRLVFFREGRRMLRARVAVGASITPTPTGKYYVNQRLTAPDPWGPFGPAAIGISAFSPVLQEWAQGGPIAIHGTNDPGSIGQAASHGCVRVRNDVLSVLFRQVPVGTPVVIRA